MCLSKLSQCQVGSANACVYLKLMPLGKGAWLISAYMHQAERSRVSFYVCELRVLCASNVFDQAQPTLLDSSNKTTLACRVYH